MKAVWSGEVIAESNETILIEGNHYFPPSSVKKELLETSETHTICPWKGEASYYTISVDGKKNPDGAWYYPEPKDGAVQRVKADFANYVAFWRGVEVTA